MSWIGIEGHDEMAARFQRAITHGRLASTFLFVGAPGIGKRMFAERLAQTLQCEKNDPQLMQPCGVCDSCRDVIAHTHPDVYWVQKPEERAFIPIDSFIGPKEARNQMGLCVELSKTPVYKKRKIGIIDDADFLNIEGANSLLKTLEEPPNNAILILIGTSTSRQLPTIRSRCQLVRFSPLSVEVVETLLRARRQEQIRLAEEVETKLNASSKRSRKTTKTSKKSEENLLDESLIPQIAACSGGSMQEALALADEAFWTFRDSFLRTLAQGVHDRILLASQIQEQLEAVGKVPALRRMRLLVLVETAADFFRRLARALVGGTCTDAREEAFWKPYLQLGIKSWPFNAEIAAGAAVKAVDYLELIQRNIHQPTFLDAWLDELVRFAEGDSVPAGIAPWALRTNL